MPEPAPDHRSESIQDDSLSGSFLERRLEVVAPPVGTETSGFLSAEQLQDFAFPIHGHDASEGSVEMLIGIGYQSFEHPSEQVHYRGVSRIAKRYLGRDLQGEDVRLAIYCGHESSRSDNYAVNWEAARLSAKSGGRIGVARNIGYADEPYDRLMTMPYLSDGHHPLFLALTIEASLADSGRLVVVGPAGRGGREESVELEKSDALRLLQDKQLGREVVRLRRHSIDNPTYDPHSELKRHSEPNPRLAAWRHLKWMMRERFGAIDSR